MGYGTGSVALLCCPGKDRVSPALPAPPQGTVTLPDISVRPWGALGAAHAPSHHRLGQWQNRSEAPQHWGLYINSKAGKKGAWLLLFFRIQPLAAPLPQNPALSSQGRGWRWPEPSQSHSYPKGKPWRHKDVTSDRTCNGASPRRNGYGFMSQASAPY